MQLDGGAAVCPEKTNVMFSKASADDDSTSSGCIQAAALIRKLIDGNAILG